jgi:hypothetical protein
MWQVQHSAMSNPIIDEFKACHLEHGKVPTRIIPDRTPKPDKAKRIVRFVSAVGETEIAVECDRKQFMKMWREFVTFLDRLKKIEAEAI